VRTLKGLSPSARVLVNDRNFRAGEVPAVDASPFICELRLERSIALAPLRAVVDEAMRRLDPRQSDAYLGPRVHAALRLTRRESADKRLWGYLTVVEFPDYVRWRWRNPDHAELPVPIDRFLGEDSKNALSRLWWAAELTRNGSDYSPTVAALSESRFSASWLMLNLMHHRAAALAVVDFLSSFGGDGATDMQGLVMAKAVNVALRTLSLDSLSSTSGTDAEAVREWCLHEVDETTFLKSHELPKGPDEAPVPASEVAAVRNVLDLLADRIKLQDAKPNRRIPARAMIHSKSKNS
jgi:hypothetical protein